MSSSYISDTGSAGIADLRTTYLSREGLQKCANIYRKFSDRKYVPNEEDVLDITFLFSTPTWDNFDKIYTAMYVFSLISNNREQGELSFSRNKEFFLEKPREDENIVRVDYLIDIDLIKNLNSFKMIDEFSVKRLMSFRNYFSHFIGFKNNITEFKLGCVELSFCVLVPNTVELLEIFGTKDAKEAGKELVKRRLSHPYWKNVRDRFPVIDECVNTLTLG